ncbi:MAG: hypothetical protein H6R45_832 [Proteobacteria bacterium]|nr:hypothetical protein [Pseudomonadota bacterium]
MKSKAIALAAAFGMLMVAQPALAATTAVTYDDLDLSTKEGQQELDRRIEHAAREVCGLNEKEVGSLVPSREARTCVKDARKQLEKRVAALTQDKATGS